MILERVLYNPHLAEWILNLSIQVLIFSIIGWAIVKVWRFESAPVRSACYFALIISLICVPLFSVLLRSFEISWFEIDVPVSQTRRVVEKNESSDDFFHLIGRETWEASPGQEKTFRWQRKDMFKGIQPLMKIKRGRKQWGA